MTATAVAPPPPTPVEDPDAAAMNTNWTPSPFSVFGQVQKETWFCVLQKKDEANGIAGGKVPFDPNVHDIGQRCTAIKITILPVIAGRQTTDRDLIAESAEWTKVVLPSIKALGPAWNLAGLHNQWVEVQLVPSGRKYTPKNPDGSPGDPSTARDATTIKFVRVFQSEDECLAAAQARGGGSGGASSSTGVAPASAVPAPPNASERETAKKFLPALWRASQGDLTKFAEHLAKNSVVSKYFTIDSQEVLDVVAPPAATTDGKLPF